MKRFAAITCCVLFSAALAGAVGPKAGGYLGYTAGGDVEQGTIAYGAFGGLGINDYVGVRVSVGMSGDEFDMTHDEASLEEMIARANDVLADIGQPLIALTDLPSGFSISADEELSLIDVELLLVGTYPVSENLKFYAAGGFGYYIADLDASATIRLGPDAEATGAPAWIRADADVSIDPTVGFLALVGVAFLPTPNVEIFAEYCYRFLTLDPSIDGATVSSEDGSIAGTVDAPQIADVDDMLAQAKDDLRVALEAAGADPAVADRMPSTIEDTMAFNDDYNQGMLRIGAAFLF